MLGTQTGMMIKHLKHQERCTKSFNCRSDFSFSKSKPFEQDLDNRTPLSSHRTCLIPWCPSKDYRYFTFSLTLQYHTNVCMIQILFVQKCVQWKIVFFQGQEQTTRGWRECWDKPNDSDQDNCYLSLFKLTTRSWNSNLEFSLLWNFPTPWI